jgi:hypothetical protein
MAENRPDGGGGGRGRGGNRGGGNALGAAAAAPDVALPRWTSRFTLSAQKPSTRPPEGGACGEGGGGAGGSQNLVRRGAAVRRALGAAPHMPRRRAGDRPLHGRQLARRAALQPSARRVPAPAPPAQMSPRGQPRGTPGLGHARRVPLGNAGARAVHLRAHGCTVHGGAGARGWGVARGGLPSSSAAGALTQPRVGCRPPLSPPSLWPNSPTQPGTTRSRLVVWVAAALARWALARRAVQQPLPRGPRQTHRADRTAQLSNSPSPTRPAPLLAATARQPPAAKQQQAAAAAATPKCDAAAGGDEADAATPLACLFDRFDALALDGGATGGGAGAAGAPAARRVLPSTGGAAASGAPLRAPKSPLGPARRVDAGHEGARAGATAARRETAARGARVSFGTPVVHRYGGGGVGAAGAQAAADGGGGGGGGRGGCPAGAAETPLWSNAGHTPYSVSGGRGGGRARGVLGISPLGGPDFDAVSEEGDEGGQDGPEDAGEAAAAEGVAAAQASTSSGGGGSAASPQLRDASFEFCVAAPGAHASGTPVLTGRPAAHVGGEVAGGGPATPVPFGGNGATAAEAAAAEASGAAGGGGAEASIMSALPFARELWGRAVLCACGWPLSGGP